MSHLPLPLRDSVSPVCWIGNYFEEIFFKAIYLQRNVIFNTVTLGKGKSKNLIVLTTKIGGGWANY